MSGEIPIQNIYYLLCYAWEALEEKDELAAVGAEESPDLLNLFARVLAHGTHRLLHRGLDRGYLAREGEIAGVRGKLLVTPTLRRQLLRQGRAACTWDELEYDTLPNQILKTTLARLAADADLKAEARAQVRDVLRWLSPVSTLDLHATHFRRVQLHRNNRIYVFLLHVCAFVHEHWLPDAAGGARRFRDFLRKGMPALFQKFVCNFYAHELPGWKVSAPHIHWAMEGPNEDALALVPRMMTDVCLSAPGRAIILDTKFYASALSQRSPGSERLHTTHLYQLFAYLRHQSLQSGWETAEGVLLYPKVDRTFAPEFTTHGHRIRALTLDLHQPWAEIARQLLAVIHPRPESLGAI